MTRYFADNDFDRDHGRGDRGENRGWGSDRDRGFGERYIDEYAGRDRDRRDDRHDDRGFIDRAGDEVRSWFRDEDAVRRRTMDDIHDYEGGYHKEPGRYDNSGRDLRAGRGPDTGDMGRRTFMGEHGGDRTSYDRDRSDRDRHDRDWSDRGSNYSNPRSDWSDRDRGYEHYYRQESREHERGPGGYARSDSEPWTGRNLGGRSHGGVDRGGYVGNGRRLNVFGGNPENRHPDHGNNGHDDRTMHASRGDRNVFDRAADEVRSWGHDDDDRREGRRFDDYSGNRYQQENRDREEWHPNRYQAGMQGNRDREEWRPNPYQADRSEHPATRRSSDRW